VDTIGLSRDLDQLLGNYLRRRLADLDREEAERSDRARQTVVHNRVVEMGTFLALLVAYSGVAALLSKSTLGQALIDRGAIDKNLGRLDQFIRVIPDYLRGPVFTLLSAGILLALRVASLKARTAVGGSVFVGLAALSLIGFSTALTTGMVGIVFALPGIAAVIILLRQFLRFLGQVEVGPTAPLESRTWSRRYPAARELARGLDRLHAALLPKKDGRLAAVFVGVPFVAAAFVFLAAATSSFSGPLYWTSWFSQRVFVLWCIWACSATPAAIRIPLWSAPVSGSLFLTLFAYGPVTIAYAMVLLLVFLINVLMAVPLRRGSA
jgi:hypothetical protein